MYCSILMSPGLLTSTMRRCGNWSLSEPNRSLAHSMNSCGTMTVFRRLEKPTMRPGMSLLKPLPLRVNSSGITSACPSLMRGMPCVAAKPKL